MSIALTQAERASAPATVSYTRVGDAKTDKGVTYAVVESNAAGKPMYLEVSRPRKGKDASVKRHPLAPIATAMRLGVIK